MSAESLTKEEQMGAILWIMQHACADYYCVEHDECAICRCEPECMDRWIED